MSADTVKLSNPKDSVGTRKVPLSTLPARVLWRVGLAMMEGALKYGRHNYREVGVRASVYFDSVVSRHLFGWWEGQDNDPDSGLNHIDKAIAGLMVLRDSMLQGNWVDDRPPACADDMAELNAHAGALIDRYGHQAPKHCTQVPAEKFASGALPPGVISGGVQYCAGAPGPLVPLNPWAEPPIPWPAAQTGPRREVGT